jgi:NAD(P)-dependent dehydrogenase (short-subunit alcohol dehydrogenase family)
MSMTQDNAWTDKVAIVTGGSSGIGRATALALAERGAKVVITGRDLTRLDAVADSHANLLPLRADSADPASADQAVAVALGEWGQLDLLVNNAGAGGMAPVEHYDADTIARMCAINILAPSLMLKAALSGLRDSRGAVINIATAVSRRAAPGLAHYAATKTALEHLTRSWAAELAGDGIRVNAIAPGPVESGALTGMMGLTPEMAAAVKADEAEQIPLGRRGVTDDLLPWILQLGSSDNAWLTGQVITVDGGWSNRN